jgi:hypothetical protein
MVRIEKYVRMGTNTYTLIYVQLFIIEMAALFEVYLKYT